MGRRIDLQHKLEDILGSRNVYFQPPPDIRINYPCIIYTLDSIRSQFADDLPYRHTNQYTITHIDRNPETDVHPKLIIMPMTTFDRRFYQDGLNHNVYKTYF